MASKHPVIKGLAIAAAAVVGTAALVAPRRTDSDIDARWKEFERYRYAHRGLHDITKGIPENSLMAYRLAHEGGYGVELDVHLTADHQLVCIHDADTTRVCGEYGIIENLTLDEIREYRLGGTEELIPTFQEALAIYEQPYEGKLLPMIIEVKCEGDNARELTRATVEELDRHKVLYCMESFDPRAIMWLAENRPDIIRGQLSHNYLVQKSYNYLPWSQRMLLTGMFFNVKARPDFIAYRNMDIDKNPFVWLACRVLGGHLVTWTVRDEATMIDREKKGSAVIFERFQPSPRSIVR